jgi:hypothetical protein
MNSYARSEIELLSLNSSTLSKGGKGGPRLARDEEYASAVLRVNEFDTFDDKGCVALIADILGDDIRWHWGEGQVQYNKLRQRLVVPNDADGRRDLLAGRLRASIDALKSQPGADSSKIGALGYCFGGQLRWN